MRSFLFFQFLWLLIGIAPRAEETVEHRLIVQPLSTVSVTGKTNVNEYQCKISRYAGTDTLVLEGKRGKGAIFTKGKVSLDAGGFDCGMHAMTKDFAKTIKADQFPLITIEFISFERVPEYETTPDKFKGKLKISLAQATVPFEVRCSVTKDENGYIHLMGSRNFTFSDFELKPPSKMGGLIKVNEKLVVNFHMVLLKL